MFQRTRLKEKMQVRRKMNRRSVWKSHRDRVKLRPSPSKNILNPIRVTQVILDHMARQRHIRIEHDSLFCVLAFSGFVFGLVQEIDV